MRKIFTLIFIILIAFDSNSQNSRYAFLSYIFPSDSIGDFNEETAKSEALSRGFFGNEFKVFMYRAKRNYLNEKYRYNVQMNSFNKNVTSVINVAPCTNMDFESSPTGSIATVSGWVMTEGQNSSVNGSCTMAGCCPTLATGANSWIRTTPFLLTNPAITLPNSPLGGSKVLQLNDHIVNTGQVVRLEQTFNVTASNSVLQYAYWCVMDASGHTCCDNPYFNALLYDCSNNLISAGSTSLVVPGAACSSPTVTNWYNATSGISYHTAWQVKSINLNAYIGSCVKLQVTVGDCDGWAHVGYCFFDAKCGSGLINVNGASYVPSGVINTCGTIATMSAAISSTPNVWNGPPGSGITSLTANSVTTTVSGSYTLSTGTGTNLTNNIFTLNINPIPSVSLTASSYTACTNGATVALTGSPSGGVFTGTNVSGPKFTPSSTPGIYPITYNYTNPVTGCSATATTSIAVNICTGVGALNQENTYVKIFPNPNNGEFTIEAKGDDIVTIANELGQVIKTIKLNAANNYSASVTNLPAGIYFVSGNHFKEKIIVTK